MAQCGGMERKGVEELRIINQGRVLNLRQKGYTFPKIAEELGISVGSAYKFHRDALVESSRQREALQPVLLEQTIQGFDQLEEIILARGRINLDALRKRSAIYYEQAQRSGGPVNGRTAAEWEIEIERLTNLADATLGLDNDDLDRLHKIRDRRAVYLGVEPAKKIDVEHTFVNKAQEAQNRLRERLGLVPVPTSEGPVQEAEVVEPAENPEESADA